MFLVLFFVYAALAQEERQFGAGAKEEISEEESMDIESEDYDISETIKKGKQVILDQKNQLEEKEKKESKEEIDKKAEEEAEEARREVYQQKIVQEAVAQRPITTLERQLQRERFRREIMVAAGKEAVAPFKLRKRFALRASETYDDNVFLVKTGQKNDYITTVSPSILFSMSSKFIGLDANYVVDITRYRNNTKQSGTSQLFLMYVRPGSLQLPFFNRRRGGKIGFEFQDDFQPFVTSVATTEQTQRTDRTYNKLFAVLDYYMSTKRTLALEYTNIYEHYRTTGLQSYSYTENEISPTFYFHIRPKWSVFAGYEYGTIDYSQGTRGSRLQHLRAGVTGKLFTKVLGRFEIGKEWRVYKQSSNGKAQKIFFKSALLNKFTPFTTGSLEINRTIEESGYTNNPYYIEDDINIYLEHKLASKTVGIVGFEYIHDGYDRITTEDGETKKREDVIWNPRVGLKYYFKRWLNADLTYKYKIRTSNFKNFGYVDNQITGGVNIGF
ncbi:MAG: outer membrane beta-barrel protein [Candidatus Omnitrophica bacterium]|nr:outer membrane beta-barrel protein [Candidatus Omnitrophota bacterium]